MSTPHESGYGIAGFRLAVGLSSVFGLTGLPGQIGIYVQYLAGGSLEIGGASLTWGQGCVMPTLVAPAIINTAGTIYLVASGATAIATGYRLMSNPELAG